MVVGNDGAKIGIGIANLNNRGIVALIRTAPKINQIRRKISSLRAKMLETEGSIRDQVSGDLDCMEMSVQLMAMRREMVSLIRERDALGGREECPNIAERLRENYRPVRNVLGKRA